MKKKLYCLICFAAALCTVLCGCAPSRVQEDDGRIHVVATSFAPYDLAREVAGECADVQMLLPPGSESHSFEPTAQDILDIAACDVFVYVGGESDEWIEGILDSVDTEHMMMVPLMEMTDTMEEEHAQGMTLRRHVHHSQDCCEHEEYDEHVWTSPRNAMQIVQGICDALCEADADNEERYVENARSYTERLEELDEAFCEVVENASRRELVFGDRFPFLYFAKQYGLSYSAAFPGCSAQTEPSAATLAYLIDRVRQEQIPVVFQVELSSGNIARAISETTGARVRTLYACHNISAEKLEEGATYLSLMWENVASLREALE